MSAKSYMIGNWKMNQNLSEVKSFFQELKDQKIKSGNFWIAPQMVHIATSLELTKDEQFKIGAQNTSDQNNGAFTGETSAQTLKDLGAHFTLIGHSERRSYYQENNQIINAKVKKAIENKLIPVLCIGETLEERESNKTIEIVLEQLKSGLQEININNEDELIVAYEPVWAIGTGKTATPEQAQEVHAKIREALQQLYPCGDKISILYGGSVKPANVKELLSQRDINGGLVGGASLKAIDFTKLCAATLS